MYSVVKRQIVFLRVEYNKNISCVPVFRLAIITGKTFSFDLRKTINCPVYILIHYQLYSTVLYIKGTQKNKWSAWYVILFFNTKMIRGVKSDARDNQKHKTFLSNCILTKVVF